MCRPAERQAVRADQRGIGVRAASRGRLKSGSWGWLRPRSPPGDDRGLAAGLRRSHVGVAFQNPRTSVLFEHCLEGMVVLGSADLSPLARLLPAADENLVATDLSAFVKPDLRLAPAPAHSATRILPASARRSMDSTACPTLMPIASATSSASKLPCARSKKAATALSKVF